MPSPPRIVFALWSPVIMSFLAVPVTCSISTKVSTVPFDVAVPLEPSAVVSFVSKSNTNASLFPVKSENSTVSPTIEFAPPSK